MGGPSIHDIDDDGVPEVIREGVVFNGKTGTLRSLQPPNYQSYSQGNFSVLANLDQDPAIELTNGQYIWKWTGRCLGAQADLGTGAPGFVAIADFGAYGTGGPRAIPRSSSFTTTRWPSMRRTAGRQPPVRSQEGRWRSADDCRLRRRRPPRGRGRR